jgi:hypothetical protein
MEFCVGFATIGVATYRVLFASVISCGLPRLLVLFGILCFRRYNSLCDTRRRFASVEWYVIRRSILAIRCMEFCFGDRMIGVAALGIS